MPSFAEFIPDLNRLKFVWIDPSTIFSMWPSRWTTIAVSPPIPASQTFGRIDCSILLGSPAAKLLVRLLSLSLWNANNARLCLNSR